MCSKEVLSIAYSKEFRKEVVDYALATSYSKAAEKYNVGKGSITRWIKKTKNRTEQGNGTEQDETLKKKINRLSRK